MGGGRNEGENHLMDVDFIDKKKKKASFPSAVFI